MDNLSLRSHTSTIPLTVHPAVGQQRKSPGKKATGSIKNLFPHIAPLKQQIDCNLPTKECRISFAYSEISELSHSWAQNYIY
jgi:hypothetical protein